MLGSLGNRAKARRLLGKGVGGLVRQTSTIVEVRGWGMSTT